MCAQFLHSSNLGIYIFKHVEVLLILNCIDYDLRAIVGPKKRRFRVNEDFHV